MLDRAPQAFESMRSALRSGADYRQRSDFGAGHLDQLRSARKSRP